jgi:glycine/D-amino acid oxidase-like deaminating enzyme
MVSEDSQELKTKSSLYQKVLPRVANDTPLPKETDVVVIGGGLAGCATAYYLAKQGVECVVLERRELNREASGSNAGSLHFQIALHQIDDPLLSDSSKARLIKEISMYVEASRVWQTLENELSADLGVAMHGGFMVAETDEQVKTLYWKQKIEEEAGLSTCVMDISEAREFVPQFSDRVKAVDFCPLEGHANPLLVTPAYAARAQQLGALFFTNCEVQNIEYLSKGIQGPRFKIHSTHGVIHAHRVVNAAGAWANDLSVMLNVSLPISRMLLHVNVTERYEYNLKYLVQHIGRRLTLKQAEAGNYLIGGGWPARSDMNMGRYKVRWDSGAGNVAVAKDVIPELQNAKIIRMWAGSMPFVLDMMPIIGEVSKVPGYYICIATTGFTLLPLLAQVLAEAIVMHKNSLMEYSPARLHVY